MSGKINRGIELRAQQIAMTSGEPISVQTACEQAIREQIGTDPEALIKVLAGAVAGQLRSMRRTTYHLNEEGGQGSLFDIPQVIVVTTPESELVIPKVQAETGQVRQWQKEGQQHHSVQLTRFKRFGKELEAVADQEDGIPWSETREVLTERKLKELEQ